MEIIGAENYDITQIFPWPSEWNNCYVALQQFDNRVKSERLYISVWHPDRVRRTLDYIPYKDLIDSTKLDVIAHNKVVELYKNLIRTYKPEKLVCCCGRWRDQKEGRCIVIPMTLSGDRSGLLDVSLLVIQEIKED